MPLNSSNITSSILLPVSINAVEIIVKLPPSSTFLAAPKNRLGLCNAFESTPPDKIFPLCGCVVLYALASLVIESNKITTSSPVSTHLLAFSITISATCTCLSAGSSNVDATTSASTLRAISVTSSGLSSINKIINLTSFSFVEIALAIFCNKTVLPVLGCATIKPLWPFPIGANISMILVE